MSTAITTQASNAETAALLQENMGDMAITAQDLIKVKVPAGGGTTWEIPTGEGDETDAVKVIEGIIIAQMPLRLAFNDEKQLVCKSDDGKIGQPAFGMRVGELAPSGVCASCPLNAWGSKGRGKACGDKMVLYIMRDDEILPLTVTLPPTSLSPWRQYTLLLSTKIKKPFYGLKTKISLKKIAAEGRDPYSVVQFAPGEIVEDLDGIRAWKNSFLDILKASVPADPPMQSGVEDLFDQPTHHAATTDDIPSF